MLYICVNVCRVEGDRAVRKAYVCIQTLNDVFYDRALKEEEGMARRYIAVYKRTHKTNTEAFCVSPSATDLPFVYSALPGYSL